MGRAWKTGVQGDPGSRLQGEGEPWPSGDLETFPPVSKQEAGEKAASYIIARSSYLSLRNKLGGGRR